MENTSESKGLDSLTEAQETEELGKEHLSARTDNGEAGKDIDVHARNGKGRTPLMEAAGRDDSEAIKRLLDLGSDVNARDDNGWTPLMFAAHKTKNPEVAYLLLQAGADVTMENDAGRDVFVFAKMNGYLKGSDFYRELASASKSAKERTRKKPAETSPESAPAEPDESRDPQEANSEPSSESGTAPDKAESKSLLGKVLGWFSGSG